MARFRNVRLPLIEPCSIDFFTCEHLTRELLWRAEWETHINGAERVTDVIIIYQSPPSLLDIYAEIYGKSALEIDAQGLIVNLGSDRISILTPAAFNKRFPSVPLPTTLEQGRFVGATFKVRSLATLESILSQIEVPITYTPSGSIVIQPKIACDTLLEFSELS